MLFRSRDVTVRLLRDVDVAGKRYALLQPSGASQAIEAVKDILGELEGSSTVTESEVSYLSDSYVYGAAPEYFAYSIRDEIAKAEKAINLRREKSRQKKKWILGGCVSVLAIAAILLIIFRTKLGGKSSSEGPLWVQGIGEDAGLVPDSVLNSEQNYLSLLMQAAADRPVSFTDFGISRESYRLLRQLQIGRAHV